jgi:hypothetical protein
MEMRAIETIYNGYRFRSRLEARWAVFFDAVGMPYRYELEGFNRGPVNYLPDFWFPNGIIMLGEDTPHRNVWAEVKPAVELTGEARAKIANLVWRSSNSLLLLTGDPGPEATLRYFAFDPERQEHYAPDVKWIDRGPDRDIGLMRLDHWQAITDPDTRQIAAELTRTPRLLAAYSAARQARFDGTGGPRSMAGSVLKTCLLCGQPFTPKSASHQYCYPCYRKVRGGYSSGSSGAYRVRSSAQTESAYTGSDSCGMVIFVAFVVLALLTFLILKVGA